MPQRSLAPVLVSIALCSCQAAGYVPSLSHEDADAAVRDLLAIQDSVASAGDLEGFVSLVAEDAMVLPPDDHVLRGKGEIQEWYAALFRQFKLEIQHIPDDVNVVGSVIVHTGDARGRLIPREGGDAIPFDNKYLFVTRIRPDQSLEHWRGVFNSNPAPGQ